MECLPAVIDIKEIAKLYFSLDFCKWNYKDIIENYVSWFRQIFFSWILKLLFQYVFTNAFLQNAFLHKNEQSFWKSKEDIFFILSNEKPRVFYDHKRFSLITKFTNLYGPFWYCYHMFRRTVETNEEKWWYYVELIYHRFRLSHYLNNIYFWNRFPYWNLFAWSNFLSAIRMKYHLSLN